MESDRQSKFAERSFDNIPAAVVDSNSLTLTIYIHADRIELKLRLCENMQLLELLNNDSDYDHETTITPRTVPKFSDFEGFVSELSREHAASSRKNDEMNNPLRSPRAHVWKILIEVK